jgi:hypothetical protein
MTAVKIGLTILGAWALLWILLGSILVFRQPTTPRGEAIIDAAIPTVAAIGFIGFAWFVVLGLATLW